MRVTCKSCGAQYNLPDDKVQGRKAKVRCKKCSASIVVDGTSIAPGAGGPMAQGFEDDEATQVMRAPMAMGAGASSDNPDEWTVNLSDDEQRQMTTDELVEGWLSGTISDDAFVWREGMSDWSALPDVPELAEKLAAAQAARPQPAPAKATPASDPFAVASPLAAKTAATEKVSSSPFTAPAPGSAPKPVLPGASRTQASSTAKPSSTAASTAAGAAPRAMAARPATFDLFGPPRSIQRDSMPRAPSPPLASSSTTNENSMVFSLDALKAAAGKEDAQLADTRASEDLLTMGSLDAPAAIGGPLIEVIPSARPDPEPFAATAGPVMPTAFEPPPKKKAPVWIWGAAAAAVLVVGFFGGRMLMGGGEDPVRAGTTVDPALAEAEEKLRLAEELRKKAEAERLEAEAERKKAEDAAKLAQADEQKDGDKKDDPGKQASPSNPGGSSGSGSSGSGSSGSGSSGSGSSGSGSSGSGSSGSSSDSKGTSSGDSKGSSGGGAKFNVSAAKASLSAAAASAKSCKSPGGPTGTGKVQVTFATSGRVTSAQVVSGPFGGTSVGGCVARTFRSAKVPPFDGSPTTVAKSFTIK